MQKAKEGIIKYFLQKKNIDKKLAFKLNMKLDNIIFIIISSEGLTSEERKKMEKKEEETKYKLNNNKDDNTRKNVIITERKSIELNAYACMDA